MPAPSPATQASLLDKARGRHAGAWDRLVGLYTPVLQAWLAAAGLQPADRDDLTQRVLEILVRQLPDFEHSGRPGAFRAWLRGITVNLLREHWRARTEPGAGSDSAASATMATKVPGGWKITGTKMFMTNASVAGVYTITAVTDREAPKHQRISAFILERKWKGIAVAKKEDKLGCRASDTCIVNLDDVFVPDENLLGERGRGFDYFMKILDGGRIGIGAMAIGLAESGYERAVSYARERRAFDKPIGMHQAVAFKIADMAVQIQAAKHLIYHAATLKDAGRPFKREASMGKLFASEMAMRVLRDAIQVLGGYGYMTEYQIERAFRDAKLCEIGEGTSEIQRIVISRDILGRLS